MSVDFSGHPPGLVLLAITALDTVCQPLQCQNWRSYAEPFCSDWCSHSIESISEVLTPFLSYSEFLNGAKSTWREIIDYAFFTDSTALADLTTPTAAIALFVLVLCFRLIKSVLIPYFSGVGREFGRRAHGPGWEANNEIRIVKFGEYVFRLLYHSFISVVGIWYFYDKEWWSGTRTAVLYENWPYQEVEVGMIWYYLVQCAYNVEALVSLAQLSFDVEFQNPLQGKLPFRVKWSETVRGDFQEMAIHHVVTNLLIFGSSYFRFTRSGSMVFLVHDISDVPVDLSKLANFVKWKISTIVCFTFLILFWLIFRLGILPFYIYKSMLTETYLTLSAGAISVDFYLCYRPIFFYLMGQIILLHIVWLVILLRIGYYLYFKGQAHDFAEHKDGEEDHPLATGNGSSTNDTAKHATTNGKKTQ